MDQTQPTVVAAEPAPSAEVPSKKGLFSFLNPMNWFGGGKPKEEVTPPAQPASPPATPTPTAPEQPLTPSAPTPPV